MRVSKFAWLPIALLVAALGAGCDEDPVAPGDNGVDPVQDLGPFRLLDVFLRPYSIQRPSAAGGLPTPAMVEHYLSGFYSGGSQLAVFDWDLPAAIGTIEPKTPNLSRNDATVVVRLRPDGNTPLGLFWVETLGRSGADSASMRQRFAVIENTWVKHRRTGFSGDEPEDLISWPTFLTHATGPATADSILFVQSTSGSTVRIRRMGATLALSGSEQTPDESMLLPLQPDINNYSSAPKLMPDVAPLALGRREMLFTSSMDPQWPARCGGASSCSNQPGMRMWVVPVPTNTTFFPTVLTRDSTYTVFGRTVWYAFDFEQPKYNPMATAPAAQIAFISDLGGSGRKELWLGDLLDMNGDHRSDSLTNYRNLAPGFGVSAFDWHPDGTRLCATGSRGLVWIDAGSGAVSTITLPDSNLTKVSYPSVFWRQGENTLIAFQAEAENLRNLYVYDVEANTVTRLLPYSVPVTHNLFPNWHPSRKRLAYVSDYTVMPWAESAPGTSLADRLNPNNPELYGMPRTYYPSVWVLSLE